MAQSSVMREFSRFYARSIDERRALLQKIRPDLDFSKLCGDDSLSDEVADKMVENAIGSFRLALGVLPCLVVNGFSWVVPMVTEEASVVAGANKAAKYFNACGGVNTRQGEPHLWGQIQLIADVALDQSQVDELRARLLMHESALLDLANGVDPVLVSLGGGACALRMQHLGPGTDACGQSFVIVELCVKTLDAMGANAVNSMLEALCEPVAKLLGLRAGIAILSNDGEGRLVHATVRMPLDALPENDGVCAADIAHRIACASVFAQRAPLRAVTHNKGIMNGVTALCLALGQDTRAIEASAHHYAARRGCTQPLSQWEIQDTALCGSLCMPLLIGTVGGARTKHEGVRAAFELLGTSTYTEVSGVVAALGLAQNFAALWALASTGIQRAHMHLHRR